MNQPLTATLLAIVVTAAMPSQGEGQAADLDAIVAVLEPKAIQWRRDIHEHPELSNREFRTSRVVAEHLTSLGIEVVVGVAHTGVVGLLRGGRSGPVVALRADMDALPIEELNDLPFRSLETSEYGGATVPVMHACGHDAHVAILMAVAEALSGMRAELSGTVKFIFQPAEEGVPEGEDGGAELMVTEGVLSDPDVDAIFGLHVDAQTDVGTIMLRSGPLMASSQDFRIVVTGRQTHGAYPADGIDPLVTASQIVLGLQTVVSRSVDLGKNPAVVTVGTIHGGVRSNVIPADAELTGTIRTFDPQQRATVHRRVREVAEHVAASAGAQATVEIPVSYDYPVTYNDPGLSSWAAETLERVAGPDGIEESPLQMGAEDFAFFSQAVPGFYFFVGVKPLEVPVSESGPHHSPDFFVDESGLALGIKAYLALTLGYLAR